MNRLYAIILLVAVPALMPACGGSDHGHDHGAPRAELPTVAVTHWTDRTELFMEYPVLVAGRLSRSAIHVTNLADFSPLSEGEAIVSLRGQDGTVLKFRGGPSRPGIFGVDMAVHQGGVYDMSLRVEAPNVQDLHELGKVTVYPDRSALPQEREEGEAIAFLKEQQWILEFGTTAAAARSIRPGVTVPASVQPRPGGDAMLTAPVPGRVDPDTRVPVPGAKVRAGAILARIIPRSGDLRDSAGLRAALVQAEQSYQLALKDRDRMARMVEARAVPARRLDEAQSTLESSRAVLDAARERWNRFESLSLSTAGTLEDVALTVRSPFTGVVSEVRFAAGGSVEENQAMIRIVDPHQVHIVGAVTELLGSGMGDVTAGELLVDDRPPVNLDRPFAMNPVVDPVARTTEIRFPYEAGATGLRIGQAVRLRLFVGAGETVTAVPESAVLDDGGRPVVFVQTGGESFQRRPVRLGHRADGYVQVLGGLAPGERVVHRGGYLVRLAAMSSQIPAHGHVH